MGFYQSLKGVSAQHNRLIKYLPNIYIHNKLQSGSYSNCLSVLDKNKECESHLLLYTPWHARKAKNTLIFPHCQGVTASVLQKGLAILSTKAPQHLSLYIIDFSASGMMAIAPILLVHCLHQSGLVWIRLEGDIL